jgi:hypothetical protein
MADPLAAAIAIQKELRFSEQRVDANLPYKSRTTGMVGTCVYYNREFKMKRVGENGWKVDNTATRDFVFLPPAEGYVLKITDGVVPTDVPSGTYAFFQIQTNCTGTWNWVPIGAPIVIFAAVGCHHHFLEYLGAFCDPTIEQFSLGDVMAVKSDATVDVDACVRDHHGA